MASRYPPPMSYGSSHNHGEEHFENQNRFGQRFIPPRPLTRHVHGYNGSRFQSYNSFTPQDNFLPNYSVPPPNFCPSNLPPPPIDFSNRYPRPFFPPQSQCFQPNMLNQRQSLVPNFSPNEEIFFNRQRNQQFNNKPMHNTKQDKDEQWIENFVKNIQNKNQQKNFKNNIKVRFQNSCFKKT